MQILVRNFSKVSLSKSESRDDIVSEVFNCHPEVPNVHTKIKPNNIIQCATQLNSRILTLIAVVLTLESYGVISRDHVTDFFVSIKIGVGHQVNLGSER